MDVDLHRGLSILSIDMGIKNLAYAHLVVPGVEVDHSQQGRRGSKLKLKQNKKKKDGTAEMKKGKEHTKKSLPSSHKDISSSTLMNAMAKEDEEKANPTPIEDEEFYPLALAPRAYTIVTALLDAYKPTHVLIERQRTRSQNGSSVLESTLRVGVFEGMLYSIFLTLARERPGTAAPMVVPVEPQRVARFLAQKSEEGVQGYRIKEIAPNGLLHRWIDAYLNKWPGLDKGTSSRRRSPKRKAVDKKTLHEDEVLREVPKLDDLADSLVQGVTWLDWMRTRDRVAREGESMLGLSDGKSKKKE
ncbi:hypothetical protein N8T08_006977 [Aspergillus melleus]|uniref:Uncharacterized protein n=1 Tax=Aspergillus melleus TaxID=138277 RepID=A0ACC3AYM8_9EURO|nr:hypothetical protein N8T08_006977 [Aspergillus melleus]